MNAIDPSRASNRTASAPSLRSRIQYLDPASVADVELALGQAAALGFTHVAIPPVFATGRTGDRFLPASLTEAADGSSVAAALRAIVGQCEAASLKLIADVGLDRLAAEFADEDVPFAPAVQATPLDPRKFAAAPVRTALDETPEQARAVGTWWGRIIASWRDCGVAGVRLLGLDHLRHPGETVASIRATAPNMLLIGWTPGMTAAATDQLRGTGLDYVVSSLPWWDWRADWLWTEVDHLQPIAPVLGCPEAPFGPRLAAGVHEPELLEAMYRRMAALAATIGDGWLVPAGFEHGARRPMDRRALPVRAADAHMDFAAGITALNATVADSGWPAPGGTHVPLTGGGAPVLAMLRSDRDPRYAGTGVLSVINTDPVHARSVDAADLLPACAALGPSLPLRPGATVTLSPGEMRVFTAVARPGPTAADPLSADGASRAGAAPRVAIERPEPCVDDGALPVKRIQGEWLAVEADIVCDGHDKLGAVLRWRGPGEAAWQEGRMRPLGNDRWTGAFPLTSLGAYEYDVQAWRDAFASYRDELAKKSSAGVPIALELREGLAMVTQAAEQAQGVHRETLKDALRVLAEGDEATRCRTLLSDPVAAVMAELDDRPQAATLARPVRVDAERLGARFAAWYEVFPRSLSDDPRRHGTFADVQRHLPRIRDMGFDVLYFPPIHPIGAKNRKGRNNTLTPAPDDPGSPYAIGSEDGGHDALHPELGSFDDFQALRRAAEQHGLELAIDFAIQCSPDHPWLREHHGWFAWRPDGTIKYAENPPKKYEDIVNVDFYAVDAMPDLWMALANTVLFWAEQGVRLFRVDNPHTKPLPFWQWMIGEVRARYPDAVFLAEAFTRPKVMYRLAKVGFSQSYTYFTWRETKREMEEYLTELSLEGPRDFFRPHFFVNTPDINPVFLQNSGRPGFLIRAALAATLSGLWGVYNGFELCEGTPVPGREEYLDSEKYQLRAWDWDRPGNIVPEITQLNRIRRANPALWTHLDVAFQPAGNDAVTVFEKANADRSNVIMAAISFDPRQPQATEFEFPFWHWQLPETAPFDVENLVTGETATWRGKVQRVRLTPGQPYAIWRIRAAI